MYANEYVGELSVEIVAEDGKCLFRRFRQYFMFEIIQINMRLLSNRGGRG